MTTTEIGEKLYTAQEFLALDLSEDEDYELIEGEIVARTGSTNAKHGSAVTIISRYIESFGGVTSDNVLGRVFNGTSTTLGEPLDSSKTFPKPDVCFVSVERLALDIEDIDIIPVAPDLVVEVNSPSDTEERMDKKLQAYQEAGVKLIWSVHLLRKYILIYRGNHPNPSLVTIDEELDGEDVLPGFKLPVKNIFK